MSSTNRGGVRSASDYYITPQEEIYKFLLAFDSAYPNIDMSNQKFFDPCVGGGKQVFESKRTGQVEIDHPDGVYPICLKERYGDDIDITTLDIREDSSAQVIGSYIDFNEPVLTVDGDTGKYVKTGEFISHKKVDINIVPDIIITNPPFAIAKEIIEKAVNDISDNGFVIMLLRLNFFGSKGRKSLFQNHMPDSVFIHPDRMSFTPDGKTDSIEYAHFVWRKRQRQPYAKTYHIAD